MAALDQSSSDLASTYGAVETFTLPRTDITIPTPLPIETEDSVLARAVEAIREGGVPGR